MPFGQSGQSSGVEGEGRKEEVQVQGQDQEFFSSLESQGVTFLEWSVDRPVPKAKRGKKIKSGKDKVANSIQSEKGAGIIRDKEALRGDPHKLCSLDRTVAQA